MVNALAGKRAIVRGAANGIGLAVALALQDQGALVVGLDLKASQGGFPILACDLASEAPIISAVARGADPLGGYGPEVDTWSDRTIARPTDQAVEIPGVMSAAAFGRSVGIRDKAHFLALANAGHTPTVRIVHPKTKQVQLRVTEEHMKAFHRRFLTTTTIEREFGLHRNAIVASLKAGKALPFASNGQEFGALWLRDEVAGLFKERQSARLSPRNHG